MFREVQDKRDRNKNLRSLEKSKYTSGSVSKESKHNKILTIATVYKFLY